MDFSEFRPEQIHDLRNRKIPALNTLAGNRMANVHGNGCPGSIDPFKKRFRVTGGTGFQVLEIHLDPKYYAGKSFVIEAHDNSPDNIYIQSATLNGKPLDRSWFPAKQLLGGGTLSLQMGPEPNKQWGAGMDKAPPAAK